MNIHAQAVVSPHATLGHDITIGPFCVVEEDVSIGDHCTLASRAVVKNGTTLGSHNVICEGAVIGGPPQHTKNSDRLGRVEIGSTNVIRENVTIHRALQEGSVTKVGDHNLLMVGSHIAHDCTVGNNIILANNVLLGGFVTVGDRAFLAGAVAVHQFCRIGRLVMLGGCARVVQDVPPFVTIDGQSGMVVGLNLVGLRRSGFATAEIAQLKNAYRLIYRRGLRWVEVLEQLKAEFSTGPAADFHPFFSQGTRGFVQERRTPPKATLKLRRVTDDDNDGQQVRAKAG